MRGNDAIFRKRSGAEASQLGDNLVVLEPSGKTIRGLNETAASIWELTDGRRSTVEIADCLAKEYGLPREDVLQDVIAFSDDLTVRGLFERVA